MDYVIDRYWLPWDIEHKTDWSNYESFLQATRDQKQKESQPGLLMFRLNKKVARPDFLYVFLVGETPTAGINGEQFKNAVQYVHEIGTKDSPSCEPGCRIFVMGPTSSGSMASLRHLVEADHADHKDTFTIYSGSVSSSSAIENAGLSDFQTFVSSTDVAIGKLIKELIKNGAIDRRNCESSPIIPEIAILSEAGTTYGKSLTKSEEEREKTREQQYSQCFGTFAYPREIASLRNAYQLSFGQKPAQDSNAATAKRPSLSSNLADQTNSSDEPPDFSKAQSPLSKEAVLMNFAGAMRRHHYRYIGVIGSNPLDAVFLISFLRDAVPDARVFVLDPEMLLEHEPDNVSYMGTLYVTTYPLVSRRLWSMTNPSVSPGKDPNPVPPPPHLPFATQNEVGQYNATVCLARKMLGDDRLSYLYERTDCRIWDDRCVNPLWLTVIGTGGHWPIAMLGEETQEQSSWLKAKGLPNTWIALAALLCGLAILHILALSRFIAFLRQVP
jgi:hypothetical protein